ncbi:hypothetical protein [Virgibacillus ainsalahensis]
MTRDGKRLKLNLFPLFVLLLILAACTNADAENEDEVSDEKDEGS